MGVRPGWGAAGSRVREPGPEMTGSERCSARGWGGSEAPGAFQTGRSSLGSAWPAGTAGVKGTGGPGRSRATPRLVRAVFRALAFAVRGRGRRARLGAGRGRSPTCVFKGSLSLHPKCRHRTVKRGRRESTSGALTAVRVRDDGHPPPPPRDETWPGSRTCSEWTAGGGGPAERPAGGRGPSSGFAGRSY